MDLGEFKRHIEGTKKGTKFEYGISNPFSWRGSYDEVAFSIIETASTREEILEKIEEALTGVFYGWKGGEYKYQSYTTVNFEEGEGRYSDGEYCLEIIKKIDGEETPKTLEGRVVKLAFSQK